MTAWFDDAIFYHIYPLGLCDAPQHNDFSSAPVPRLERLLPWLDHIQSLGADALYLGPLFESSAHGYDTADYYHLDRRLGSDETLARFSQAVHARGMRLVLDGVFNHVGRHFWAFRDVQARGSDSPYTDWFTNLRFGERSPFGDPFAYESWNGHFSLAKLNLHHPAVREHLFGAVASWVRDFGIDGLRLDTADVLDFDFMRALRAFTRDLKEDFWLMGEVIHGDYRRWANPETLDSVTNYECYKGLHSSLNDANYFEIAYALERQYGANGLYRGLKLYNFVDNHDVTRVASQLKRPAHLYPLYALLFTMPGTPSIYYGSEWGLSGEKHSASDAPLRPALDLSAYPQAAPHPDLPETIRRLARIRRDSPALQRGDYHPLRVEHQQLAFMRAAQGERVLVTLNAAPEAARIELRLPEGCGSAFTDLLNPDECFQAAGGRLQVEVPGCWARILRAG